MAALAGVRLVAAARRALLWGVCLAVACVSGVPRPSVLRAAAPPARRTVPAPALQPETPARPAAAVGAAKHLGGGTSGRPVRPAYGPGGYRNEVVALMYHAFRPHPTAGDVISPANLAAQFRLMRQDGFHPITLARFEAFVRGRASVPPNAVLLTFDNGYRSFYQVAYPLLRRYHYPAVLFAIVRWLSPGGAPPGIHPLTWAQVRAMAQSGLVDVQSQTWNLHAGVAVGPGRVEAADIGRAWSPAGGRETLAQYEARVGADLLRARQTLQRRLGAPVQAFAYPFGDYRPRLIRLLHQAGYRYLFAAKLGWGNLSGQNPQVLFRLNSGAYTVTAPGAIAAIRQVARDTALHPGWRPPRRSIEVWP